MNVPNVISTGVSPVQGRSQRPPYSALKKDESRRGRERELCVRKVMSLIWSVMDERLLLWETIDVVAYNFLGTRNGSIHGISHSLRHEHGCRACIDRSNGGYSDVDLGCANGHCSDRDLWERK